jgi:membrane-bound lytic murein transglycosylase A
MAMGAGVLAQDMGQDRPGPPGAVIEQVRYDALAGWAADDHALAFTTFLKTCGAPVPLREALAIPAVLQQACDGAVALARTGVVDSMAARRFFEMHFRPFTVRPATGPGFLTGYFEPEFPGALQQSAEYPTPVYGRPRDLVTRGKDDLWPGFNPELSAARQTGQGLVPHFDRGQIDDGALAGLGLEILWLRDAVDRFVMQVQGSSRIRLPDGSSVRLAYAGRNGFPYTSLGRTLTEEEGIPPAEMTMDRLVARLKSDIGKGPESKGLALIRRNRSFVYFRIASELNAADGPVGGAGVPLTPHRSIAADRTLWPYGLPVWLEGEVPVSRDSTKPLARLAVIQDTGSAILGPARFDLYFGSGEAAGDLAGRVRHPVAATVLWPVTRP